MKFEAKQLACLKGERYLFRNLSFMLARGQLAFIQGANGSGKTSLLKIIAGLSQAQKGSIQWAVEEVRSKISFLGHKDGLRQLLTVRENIQLQATLGEVDFDNNTLEHYCAALDLTKVMALPCQVLSQGQRRKVALCALMLKQKPIWILDEPFTALDKTSCEWLQDQFDQHCEKGGMIFMASHAPFDLKPAQVIHLTSKESVC